MNRIRVFGVCHGLSKNWVNNAWVNRPAIAILSDSGAVPFWGIQAVRREFKTTLSKPQQLGNDGLKLGKTTVGKPQESSVKAPRFLRVQPVRLSLCARTYDSWGERVHLFRASWEMPKLNGCVKGRNHRTELVIFQHAIFFFAGGFILISWIIFTFFWDDGSSMFQLSFFGIFLTPLLHDFMEIKWPSFERTVMG